jgi:endonuclease/exonuclease/phosphatase family metal-dependent hydrolase
MEMDLDVLAVQEVESREFLEQFNAEDLQNLYPFQVLIEGNDERLINVGLLSKLPLGAITSWRFAVHPDKPDERVFGRDLVQVEVLSSDRRQILFTVFNTHLKSHYIPFDVIDPLVRETLEQEAKAWRKRQAEVIAQLLRERLPQDCRYMVLGDFNDPPESDCLFPLLADPVLNLLNALTFAQETNQTKKDKFPLPDGVAWTVRHKASQQPPTYQLFDQIWLSPALAPFLKEAWIKRRKNLTGDGSDHDPVYVVLEGIY